MGQQLSKKAAMRNKQPASPQERAENLPIPSTISLSEIPSDLKELDGRLFKKSGSAVYILPNDKQEVLRLNQLHFVMQRIFQSDYQAPVTESLKSGIKVIDVGCGTGVWSFELATKFPNSTFMGTDITNVFVSLADKSPPNLTFLEADTRLGLPFDDNTFDYVFQRFQSACFSVKEWPGVLRELLRVAKPGGYIELLEGCTPNYGGPAFTIHREWVVSAFRLRDVNIEIFAENSLLVNAGFVDLVSQYIPWYIGGGSDATIAEWSIQNWSTAIDSFRPKLTASLGISDSEYDDVAERVRNEITDPNSVYKPYLTIYSHHGRKAAVQR